MLIPFTKKHPFPLHSGLLFFEGAKTQVCSKKEADAVSVALQTDKSKIERKIAFTHQAKLTSLLPSGLSKSHETPGIASSP